MIIREHEVPYGLGTVAVRDYGGDGPDVLLVHAPGFCAAAWDNVAESLKGDVHAYAIDLPGHGRSTAPMRRAYDAWKSILAVTEHLGLTNPLLVGLSQGTHSCLAATVEGPDVFSGVIALGGACVRSTESAADDVAFYTSPEFTEMLRYRFCFGFRGDTQKEANDLTDRLVAKLATDWRVVGFKGLREEIGYSLQPHPEGGWVNLPLPSTITTMLTIEQGKPYFPDQSMYRRIAVPVLIVQLAEGLDQEHAERERDLALENRLVSVRGLDAGEYPHYTRHNEVAAIILETCGLTMRPDMHPMTAAGPVATF